jgi:rhodanese-related sulfurtransferase
MPIAVYCYSGQHGSQVAVYLTLLGYDAWDVLYGTNGMIYDTMTASKWPGPGDFEYVID